MRDEYTALREEQDRISLEFEKQRKRYEELQERSAEVGRQLRVLRDRVVAAQGERCAYCGAYLRSNRSYQLYVEVSPLDGAALDARLAQEPVPYERRVTFQIRLKVPKSRGGSEVMENLVACCDRCGSKKNKKTHDEFLRQLEGARARAAVAQKSALRLVPPGMAPRTPSTRHESS